MIPILKLPVLLMELMDESLTRFLERAQEPVPFQALTWYHRQSIQPCLPCLWITISISNNYDQWCVQMQLSVWTLLIGGPGWLVQYIKKLCTI